MTTEEIERKYAGWSTQRLKALEEQLRAEAQRLLAKAEVLCCMSRAKEIESREIRTLSGEFTIQYLDGHEETIKLAEGQIITLPEDAWILGWKPCLELSKEELRKLYTEGMR